jgi:hypothetical protein
MGNLLVNLQNTRMKYVINIHVFRLFYKLRSFCSIFQFKFQHLLVVAQAWALQIYYCPSKDLLKS